MWVILAGLLVGLVILVWSADRFVDGSIALLVLAPQHPSYLFQAWPLSTGMVA